MFNFLIFFSKGVLVFIWVYGYWEYEIIFFSFFRYIDVVNFLVIL